MQKRFLTIFIGLTMSAFAAADFKVSSSALKSDTMANAQVYNSFGCTGENLSPDLTWSGAPKDTKSFAVTMFDPDAPTGSGWWHWTIFNIPANATGISMGASGNKTKLPDGTVEGRTDFGKPGYGGPCPPPGKPHRYIFKVFALKDVLPLDREASGAMVGFYANQMKLAEATIQAKYGRK